MWSSAVLFSTGPLAELSPFKTAEKFGAVTSVPLCAMLQPT